MPIRIEMPRLNDTMEEGTLQTWHVKVGDKVSAGDTLADIETDKAVLEVPCPFAGKIVKVHVKQGTDKIVGATIVARHAGDMISEITLAMTHGLGLGKIGGTIHPYPTQAEAIRKLGDQYSRTRLTPLVKKLFDKWLAWTR